MRRKASIVKEQGDMFFCRICDGRNQGMFYVRVYKAKICWPCARAIFRRLYREVLSCTPLARKLDRVGRLALPDRLIQEWFKSTKHSIGNGDYEKWYDDFSYRVFSYLDSKGLVDNG